MSTADSVGTCSNGNGSGSSATTIGVNLAISLTLSGIALAALYLVRRDVRSSSRAPLLKQKTSDGSDWIRQFYSQKLARRENKAGSSGDTSDDPASDVVRDIPSQELGVMLPIFWLWKTEELERRCGKSATQYLRFMEHVILFTSIVVVISGLIVLPINLRNSQGRDVADFGRTTMSNISPTDNIMWLFVVLSLLLFPMAVAFMVDFSRTFRGYARPDKATRTLMFSNLNKKSATPEAIQEYLQTAFPSVLVEKVHLTHPTARLTQLDEDLFKCRASLQFYQTTTAPPRYEKDNACLRCCFSCCNVGIDAVEYYAQKASELEHDIQEEIDKPRRLNDTFFVTFATEVMAEEIVRNHAHPLKSVFNETNTLTKDTGSRYWHTKYAPYPELIKWENLEKGGWKWWANAILLNTALFLGLFFLTSPAILLNATGLTSITANLFIIDQILPALIILELGLVVGGLMQLVVRRTHYYDRVTEALAAMNGSYGYQLLAQLILPTFGLTSAKALFDSLTAPDNSAIQWSCMFLPDSGMVFVTFFIFQSLFGSALALSRATDLQNMAVRRSRARSAAEKWLISQEPAKFNFIASYARQLALFSIVIAYAFVVPYIAPLGLFTLMVSNIADKYSLFFVYSRSEVPNPIHKKAVDLFLFAVLFELYIFAFFMAIRAGSRGLYLLLAGLVVYTFVYVYIVWLKRFGKLTEIPVIGKHIPLGEFEDEASHDAEAEPDLYEAPILRKYESLQPIISSESSNGKDTDSAPYDFED